MFAKRACVLLLPILFHSCGTASVPQPEMIPSAWLNRVEAPRLGPVTFRDDGSVQQGGALREKSVDGDVQVVDGKIRRGAVELTTAFVAIDSLDVSEERGEVAFSAMRETSYDIGLVSTEGSPISWVPSDPADELDVQWAPRGNKISYIVRTASADFVRTLHVPTSFQFSVDVPFGRVSSLTWDKPAERFAIVVESVETSPRVEVMKYDGTSRRVAIEPQQRLSVSVEPLGGGVSLRPDAIKYGEKLPLVIWVEDGDLNRWDDARATLMRDARVASLIVNSIPDAALLSVLRSTAWVDGSKMFVVDSRAVPPAVGEVFPGVTIIRANSDVPPQTYRRKGEIIETPPGVVKSFSAGFIADQLKRTSLPNASHR